MLKVAMTGGDGLVGSRIVELLGNDFRFENFPQARMDITDKQKVADALNSSDFDVFLHLAAYTNVAGAESNKESAYKINRDGTSNVFNTVIEKKRKFIYISTDFVFDGKNPPYFEDSRPSPSGTYADSKYQGEKVVDGGGMIVRISYPYRAKFNAKRDFYRTFRAYLSEGKSLTMITDSLMTPTFIDDIAYGLRYLINNYSPKIFHLVGSQSLSPYDAAMMVAEKFKLDKSLIGKTTYEAYSKSKPGLPRLAEIKSKKNDFHKMRSFEEGLTVIEKQTLKI